MLLIKSKGAMEPGYLGPQERSAFLMRLASIRESIIGPVGNDRWHWQSPYVVLAHVICKGSPLYLSCRLPPCPLIPSTSINRFVCYQLPTNRFTEFPSACVLWCIPLEQDECYHTHNLCSANRLVRFQTFILVWDNDVISFRSSQTIIAPFKLTFVPTYHYAFNDYLVFDTNYATLIAVIYIVYYFLLEPVAAVSPFTLSSNATWPHNV